MYGAPGLGKSTIALTAANNIAAINPNKVVLYISGEESATQVAMRARRIHAIADNLRIASETNLDTALGHLTQHSPNVALVVVDSVQALASPHVEGRAGGVAQTMEVTSALVRIAKESGTAVILIGQTVKSTDNSGSNLAGTRAIAHAVDSLLELSGDPDSALRTVALTKNRFGDSNEVSYYQQGPEGIEEIIDPSGLFRSERTTPIAGTCVSVSADGRRPMITEIQALVAHTNSPNPRRGVSGLDVNRVAMLTAVTERATRARLYDKDLFTATIGGRRISEPSADLAVCLAIASAATDTPMPMDLAAIAEVTLSGELRPVPMIALRVMEAVRLGYPRIIVAPGVRDSVQRRCPEAILIETTTLKEAWHAATN